MTGNLPDPQGSVAPLVTLGPTKPSIRAEHSNHAYVITLPSGHLYVGSSGRLGERIATHRSNLKANRHPNRKLQAAYNLSPDQEDWTYEAFPADDREGAYVLEQKLLDQFNDTPEIKELICNICPSATKEHISDGTKSLISAATRGERNPRYGIKHTEESKILMSTVKLSMNRRGENSKLYGTHRSDETKAKLQEAQRAKHPSVSLGGVEYATVREASRETGIPRSSIKLKLKRGDADCFYVGSNVNKNIKPSIRLAVISDIHLGHRRTAAFEIVKNLKRAVGDTPETSSLDILFLAGDVFDTLLNLPAEDIAVIDDWIKFLLRTCAKHNVLLRVLEGTPSHDWKQSRRFVDINNLWEIGCNLRYVDDLEIEYIPEIDRHVIYVPDQHSDSTEKTLRMAQELLAAKGLTQVDIAIMHGQFDYQVPPAAVHTPKHDSAAWLSMVREMISIGHDHHYSQHQRIWAQGSFDRLSHGEEAPKGHIRAYLPGNGDADVTFVENTGAKKYVTIDCVGLSTEDAMQRIQYHAVGLPMDSYVRLLLEPKHPLEKQPGVLQRTWPELTWTRHKTVTEKEALEETLDDVMPPAFVAMAITRENIKSLLLERFGRTAASQLDLEQAGALLDEVI